MKCTTSQAFKKYWGYNEKQNPTLVPDLIESKV